MPASQIDKVTRHLRASLGTVIILETITAGLVLFLAGATFQGLNIFLMLAASVVISMCAYRATQQKNGRVLAMYVWTNVGIFLAFLGAIVALAIILAVQPQPELSADTLPSEGSVQAMPLYVPSSATVVPGGPATDVAIEPMILVDPVPGAMPPSDYSIVSSFVGGFDYIAYRHWRHEHAASCAAFTFATLAVLGGWLSMKLLSIILAWKVKQSYQGLAFCGRAPTRPAPRPQQLTHIMTNKVPPAYAPTAYYIMVPQPGQTYEAPKISA